MKIYILLIIITLSGSCAHKSDKDIEKDQAAQEKMHDEFIHDEYEHYDYELESVQEPFIN